MFCTCRCEHPDACDRDFPAYSGSELQIICHLPQFVNFNVDAQFSEAAPCRGVLNIAKATETLAKYRSKSTQLGTGSA
jgi:hypothetical protein